MPKRLAETRIGYIKVKTEDAAPADDGALLDEMVPGADPNSPILSGNFDPLERISRYLSAEKAAVRTEDDCPPQEDTAAPDSAATDRYRSDRSASGFSFEEALHPQDDLKTIMMDLGLLMDE